MLQRLEARDVSLDLKVFEDALSTLGDNMASPDPSQEETLGRSELQGVLTKRVRSAVAGLDKRERYIVEHRLLADPEDELSLAEIGRQLGVSRERARQLEARAKGKLRIELEDVSATEAGADAWPEPSQRCA
jgi:RNA polymerase sigma-32 factor